MCLRHGDAVLQVRTTSVLPILPVVAWVCAFMYIVDFGINVVTATIATIATGVGIDFRRPLHGEIQRGVRRRTEPLPRRAVSG